MFDFFMALKGPLENRLAENFVQRNINEQEFCHFSGETFFQLH